MKNIKILLLSALLVGTNAMAMTSKVEKPELVKGTTIGQYAKPGAPVDVSYTTEHVSVGETSLVHIVLLSSMKTGQMNVSLKIDKNLNEVTAVAKHMSFDMKAGQNEFPIDFSVSADEDGLFYVKLHVSIKGQGMRAFAVPVYVGDAKLKKSTKIQKSSTGENISVSQAVETVK